MPLADDVSDPGGTRRGPRAAQPTLPSSLQQTRIAGYGGPNQLWSWDIRRLRGPQGIHYHLYTIIDVFSRYLAGWMIALRESADLAQVLISETCAKQRIEQDQLILHADRGSAMRSKSVAQLLIDLGVAKSHSRPHTPTDNPYSEAQFKTMKYRPDYPEAFNGIGDARSWGRDFVHWYNHEHHHTGLGLMTPATVHYGQTEAVYEQRQQALQAAYAAHPERFVSGKPTPPQLPAEVWINQPENEHTIIDLSGSAASDTKRGAQARSRGTALFPLDPAERLDIVEQTLDQTDVIGVFLPKFEPELSHNH